MAVSTLWAQVQVQVHVSNTYETRPVETPPLAIKNLLEDTH